MHICEQYLGKIVNIQIDHPLGSKHLKYKFIYELNYGHIPNTISDNGEEIDAYVLGVDYPIKTFQGKCIAVIQRINDDDKLIVVPEHINITDDEIKQKIAFQEK